MAALVMTIPRPGAGKAIACRGVAPGDWLSVMDGEIGRLGRC